MSCGGPVREVEHLLQVRLHRISDSSRHETMAFMLQRKSAFNWKHTTMTKPLQPRAATCI